MTVDVVTCGECQYWDDKPIVGEDGRSWARCRKYGWLQASDFFCKSGAVDTERKGGKAHHGLQA